MKPPLPTRRQMTGKQQPRRCRCRCPRLGKGAKSKDLRNKAALGPQSGARFFTVSVGSMDSIQWLRIRLAQPDSPELFQGTPTQMAHSQLGSFTLPYSASSNQLTVVSLVCLVSPMLLVRGSPGSVSCFPGVACRKTPPVSSLSIFTAGSNVVDAPCLKQVRRPSCLGRRRGSRSCQVSLGLWVSPFFAFGIRVRPSAVTVSGWPITQRTSRRQLPFLVRFQRTRRIPPPDHSFRLSAASRHGIRVPLRSLAPLADGPSPFPRCQHHLFAIKCSEGGVDAAAHSVLDRLAIGWLGLAAATQARVLY